MPNRRRWSYILAVPPLALLLGAYVATFRASGTGHAGGDVPDPGATAGTTRYLREDATWSAPAGGWVVGTATTGTNGQATFTFSPAFPAGVVPVVEAIAVAPTGSMSSYNVQLAGTPTNTTAVVQVNVMSGTAVSLLGLSSITLFTPASSGVVVHVAARAP